MTGARAAVKTKDLDRRTRPLTLKWSFALCARAACLAADDDYRTRSRRRRRRRRSSWSRSRD